MSVLFTIMLSFLLGRYLPKKLKSIQLSNDTKYTIVVLSLVFAIILAIAGSISFCLAYGDVDRYGSCNSPTRLNYIDPFHKLGCFLGQPIKNE